MTGNVISMANKANNAMMESPEQALRDAIADIQNDDDSAFNQNTKKLLILAIDESNSEYNVSFIQAGMKMSECVALCEVAKAKFLAEMNYL